MRRLLLVAAVAVAGCGGDDATCVTGPDSVLLCSREDISFDLDRWHNALMDSARWWGAPVSRLAGVRVVVSSERIDCDGQVVDGCWSEGTITIRPDGTCPERWLGHEVGHALIGDYAHHDPRFHGSFCATKRLPGCSYPVEADICQLFPDPT